MEREITALMSFDEADNRHELMKYSADTPEQLQQGMHALLEEAQAMGITMWYCREPDGSEYMDWTVREGFDYTPAIIWMYTENRYRWLFVYQKMMWHRMQEFKSEWEDPWTDLEKDEEGTA